MAWRDQDAKLAYLGRERFHMRRCPGALWCGEGDEFDRLRGVLLALIRRHDAMLPGSRSPVRVLEWQIRVERLAAEVGEDVDVDGPGAEPRRERHVYRLRLEGDRWAFSGGA